MDADKVLIEQLLTAYQALNHKAMADCYHESATFSDIAFRLKGRKEIHAMWHLICEKGIDVQVQDVKVVGESVRARIVDTYTFSDTGRTVVNRIVSTFTFQDGLIIDHRDECDPLEWARQAFGGLKGEVVGRLGILRRIAARRKLQAFIKSHQEYA